VRAFALALALGLALALALAAGALAGAPPPSGPEVKTEAGVARPFGTGAGQVWVLRPNAGAPRSVVVYLHGWGASSPFEWHLAWMDHLLARGSAVIFPRYQEGSYDDPLVTTIFDLEEGLRTGFEALGEPGLPVVVAGFSWGGTLAFFYAANAGRWGLPRPRAVYSVFPADPLGVDPRLDLPRLRRTRVVLLVGDRDDVVGTYGADTFWKWLRPVPASLKTYRVIRSTGKLFADHQAPTVPSRPVVRKVFWAPLDALVAEARRR